MVQIKLETVWQLGASRAEAVEAVLFPLLRAIHESGSLAQAARALGLSYRHTWGLLGKWERQIGQPLAHLQQGRGAKLSPFAQKLLWAEQRARDRLAPAMQRVAAELQQELGRVETARPDQLLIHASHDMALAKLRDTLARRGRLHLELQFHGSLESLQSLSRGRCDLAGFHVTAPGPGVQLEPAFARLLKPRTHSLIGLALREQGLMLARGNPKRIRKLDDLTRGGVRFINRQPGSGTRIALDRLLEREHIDRNRIRGYQQEEFTHLAVAATIAGGMADAGFGIRAAAVQYGLDFVLIERERYLLACHSDRLQDPLLQQLLAVLRGRAFHSLLATLPGYDPAIAGQILDTALAPS
jgi:putative molybdopterin biosynthesis protein